MGDSDGDTPSVGNWRTDDSDDGTDPLRMVANGAAAVEFVALLLIGAGAFDIAGARTLLIGAGALGFGLALLVGAVVATLDDTHVGFTVLLGTVGGSYTGAGMGVLTGAGPANIDILVAYGTGLLLLVAVVVVGVVGAIQLLQK